jgi:hypothetical protein
MILALILQAAVPAGPGTLPVQALPAKGCAAYLWSVADRRLVAMAGADPAQLRLVIDGKAIDVARSGERGTGDYGFAGTTDYARAEVSATLDMTVARRADITAGAAVPSGVLTIVRPGQDSVVVPVAGLIGCV